MTLCCVAFGIWSVYVNPYRRQFESLAVVNRLNGQSTPESAEGPRWQRWLVTTLLGNDAFVRITEVDLANRPIDDNVLRSLTGLCFLKRLSLDYTPITDDGVASLWSLHTLSDLSLKYTNVSDRGAHYLSAISSLRHLALTGTKISDAGVDDLAKLKQMQSMFIRWTRISDNGAARLRHELTHCEIFHNALSINRPPHLPNNRRQSFFWPPHP